MDKKKEEREEEKALQAVLSVTAKDANGESRQKYLKFDTGTATEVCDVVNAFGYAVQTIFLSPNGWLFLRNNAKQTLEVAEQKVARDYIGENYPERFIEVFGNVEEA